MKNGSIDVLSLSKTHGMGIRVIANGGWGFAGSYDVTSKEAEGVAKLAVRIAKASGSTRKKAVSLVEEPPVEDKYATKIKKNPFDVPTEEKVTILKEAEKQLRQIGGNSLRLTRADYRGHQEDKVFACSEGAFITQQIVFCGGGVSVVAVAPGIPPQTRSYPGSFRGDFSTSGYEFFESLDLVGNVENVVKEAVALTQAPACPSEKATLLLDGHQLMLQIHESTGHPTELDRALGTEAAYAGTSFLTPDKLGKLQYGSEHVTLTADCTLEGGLGTYGYDDEGVKARRVELVKNGRFVGYQSSRETAALIGLKESSSGMRADSPQKIPLIRMVNVNLEPTDWKRDEIVEDTKHGILMSTNKSWSIDDKRLNFQFGTEIAWEIRDGEIGRILRNPTYTGITPEFWGGMDASSRDDWRLWGTPNCGKGQPSQVMYVGHGCGTARFRDVRVGIMQEVGG
ncbi:MAG: TldD/PmbA family protein [Candidatus Thorarchaeota archaeon]|nr:TldD/PmbA family protein [Candidatus Thorarchaeota archaeon]